MELVEGSLIRIADSDVLWIVTEVGKDYINVTDAQMGIIELEGVPTGDVLDVVDFWEG